MRTKAFLAKALKSGRTLRLVEPDDNLSFGHMRKADHNLIVMTDLMGLGHEDWAVITAYYSMYQSALSLLLKIGAETKEHAVTLAVLEYFFRKQVTAELIDKFNKAKEKRDKIHALTIQDKYIDSMWAAKRARETIQYGAAVSYDETDAILLAAREFTLKMKLVINELDETLAMAVHEKLQEFAC